MTALTRRLALRWVVVAKGRQERAAPRQRVAPEGGLDPIQRLDRCQQLFAGNGASSLAS